MKEKCKSCESKDQCETLVGLIDRLINTSLLKFAMQHHMKLVTLMEIRGYERVKDELTGAAAKFTVDYMEAAAEDVETAMTQDPVAVVAEFLSAWTDARISEHEKNNA